MSDLKRWSTWPDGPMEEFTNGKYVLHSDHLEAVAEARRNEREWCRGNFMLEADLNSGMYTVTFPKEDSR